MSGKFITRTVIVVCIFSAASVSGFPQTPSPTPTPQTKLRPPCPNPRKPATDNEKKWHLEQQFFRNILIDQCVTWTSPARLKTDDAKSLVPLGIATAGLIAVDSKASSGVGTRGDLPPVSRAVSIGGSLYGTGSAVVAFYFTGLAIKNRKARETGLLSAEALINATIVTTVFKSAFGRSRPNEDEGSGKFFNGGNSHPSGHSSSIWSLATVIAYEYKCKPAVKYGAIAAATAVSLSRFSARKHFLSDILVGSAIGFYTGRYVYNAHHDVELGPCSDKKQNSTDSKRVPILVPFYEPRTRTYGGRLIVSL